MRLDRLKAFALSLPGATVTKQWGEHLVFKVAGKMFLIVSLDEQIIEELTFKCTPAEYRRLTRDIDGIVPASHNLYKSHWITLEDPIALPGDELLGKIRASYDLVVAGLPRKVRAQVAAPPDGAASENVN